MSNLTNSAVVVRFLMNGEWFHAPESDPFGAKVWKGQALRVFDVRTFPLEGVSMTRIVCLDTMSLVHELTVPSDTWIELI
jgi:hypothetical protein